jgi:hypothetical protein
MSFKVGQPVEVQRGQNAGERGVIFGVDGDGVCKVRLTRLVLRGGIGYRALAFPGTSLMDWCPVRPAKRRVRSYTEMPLVARVD